MTADRDERARLLSQLHVDRRRLRMAELGGVMRTSIDVAAWVRLIDRIIGVLERAT